MKKSVYSLVLMDDVIRAVDERAYLLGTSRSNLINQILAEKLSCITPEMKMREIFGFVSDMVSNDFQIQQQRSASLITLRTALEYKYRPTINYKVELARSPDDYIGVLRVHIRTQSSSLINLFNSFFICWIGIENKNLSKYGYNKYEYQLSDGSFSRMLLNCGELSEEKIGAAISSYVNLLDKSIKAFFSAPNLFDSYIPKLEYEYKSQLKTFII